MTVVTCSQTIGQKQLQGTKPIYQPNKGKRILHAQETFGKRKSVMITAVDVYYEECSFIS